MMPALPGYDAWINDVPEPPLGCDLDCEHCPGRFECDAWPFVDEFEEEDARETGTFDEIASGF